MRRVATLIALVALGLGLMAARGHLALRTDELQDFTHFESAHVHPAVLTPDGTRLLVVNTPDGQLSVFDLTGAEPWRTAEIPVGLEPVSVAAQDDTTAWVVNNLSDDVSIVDLKTMRVKATLRVGDEPNDVVFAGTPRRAYVSVSQEDRIRVYDPANLALAPTNIPINGRYPRSLAVNAAGTFVYAAVLFAGNRTSVLSFQEVPPDSQPQDPAFPRDPQLTLAHGAAPRVGLIVQQQGNDWRDMYGKLWNYRVPYRQQDVDVAEIPAGGSSPSRVFGDLASSNFAIAVSPSDGRLAVAGTEARNLLRFEPRLRGHMVDTRVNFITAGGVTRTVDLNPHVNYSGPGTRAERDSALGIPTGIAYSGNGARAYVTSLASDKLGVLDPATGSVIARVATVAGPTGVVVDDARGRIYVVGRFHNQLQTLSAANLHEVAKTVIGFDPTPDAIVNGRKFFYGGFTSAHGDQACASCHLFGDFDNLAWDLGDPRGHFLPPIAGMNDTLLTGFDPMKGPMTTQSLRTLPGTGRLHWRADRLGLADFNQAFVGLMGLSAQLPDSEMTAFNQFVSALVYPPNPAQHLDRSMPDAPRGQPSAKRGKSFFFDRPVDADRTCSFCHKSPNGTDGQVINRGQLMSSQDMKTPQLRNLYKKTGFLDAPGAVNKRGFGFTHDGSIDNVFNFLKRPNFEFDPGPDGDLDRRDVEAFVLAFDTGTPPSVGCQVTFDASNRSQPALIARIDTLRSQSAFGFCDMIAKGTVGGQPRGWWYQNDGTWRPDKVSEPSLSTAALLALAGTGNELSILAIPVASGNRMGNDRDRDGYRDGDELDAGSDPGSAASKPSASNRRPLVDAGPNLSVTLPASANLAGTASDDGVLTPLFIRWRKASGPGTVTFVNPNAAATAASFSQAGVYELVLTASDGTLTTTDPVTVTVSFCGGQVERRVAASADDAEESASGSVSLTSSDLELVNDGNLQTIGIRFLGIDIPQGAVITNAYVQFMSAEIQSEATTLKIQGQDADSAAVFTTVSRGISSRPRTDAFATWTPAAWTVASVAGPAQRTPELAALVQEIVDRPGWLSRSLALVITGTGHRTARSFDGLNTGAALLHVDYVCGSANRRPVVDAGPDQTFSYDPALRTGGDPPLESIRGGVSIEHDIPSTTLRGRVTDDGLPDPPRRVVSVWRQVGGPPGVFFVDSLAPSTIIAFPGSGIYELSLTGSDGELSATDVITIRVNVMSTIFERKIAAGSDDVEEAATGSVSLTSSDLDLMLDGSTALSAVGLRFANVAVPPGAIITSAWVQFTAKEAQSEATTLTVRAQAHDNAPAFATTSGDVSTRVLTTAQAAWSGVPAWVAGQATGAQRTADMRNVIQEIVSRPGWMGGNALAIVITGTGRRVANSFETGAAGTAVLHVEYNFGILHSMPAGTAIAMAGSDTTVMLTGAAWLHGRAAGLTPPIMYTWRRISGPGAVLFDNPSSLLTRTTFTAAGVYRLQLMAMDNQFMSHDTVAVTVTDPQPTLVEARIAIGSDDVEEAASGSVSLTSSDLEMMLDGSSPQRAVGLRFVNLAIPPGAVVSGAWVQFKAKEAQSDATTLTVRGQAHDNAPVFASTAGNVTTRMLTTAAATWSSPPAWVVGQATAAQRTPELKDVIQEIVSRPGWASGNALAIVITGTGRRVASSFEHAAANAAVLHVEYGMPPPPPPPVSNQAPTANAGADTTVLLGGAAFLHGQATDDGLPGPLMAHWMVASGPGAVTFDNMMNAVTRATFGALGSYRLEFMAMDGALEVSDSMTVTVVQNAPANHAPMAALVASPAAGVAPLDIMADASASSDADGDTLSYRFDFGDGVVTGTQRTTLASHAYATGNWTVTLIVTDGRGGADTTSATVMALANLVTNSSFETAITGWNTNGTRSSVARVAGGHTGGFCIEARGDSLPANTFGVNDAPNWVSPIAAVGARYRFSAWVRSQNHSGKAQIKVREYLSGVLQGTQYVSPLVTMTPTWQLLTLEVAGTVAGSTLDFQVMNKPVVGREVFQVDDIVVYRVPPPLALLSGGVAIDIVNAPVASAPEVRIFGAKFYPNPPGASATLDLVTTKTGFVRAMIFDAQGRVVRTLLDEPELPAGRHVLQFETRGSLRLGAGIYFYSVQSAEGRLIGKIAVVN